MFLMHYVKHFEYEMRFTNTLVLPFAKHPCHLVITGTGTNQIFVTARQVFISRNQLGACVHPALLFKLAVLNRSFGKRLSLLLLLLCD